MKSLNRHDSQADEANITRIDKQLGSRTAIAEQDGRPTLAQQFNFSFLTNTKSGLSQELIAAYQPFSPQVEVLRTIRSQLMLGWFHHGSKTLSIVSANHGEGRSYLAANLAIVFAQLGQRTLLIDGNLRKPRQHLLFNLGDCQGFSNFLVHHVDETVIKTIPDLPNLSILAAGTIPPNPLEIISCGLNACLEQLSPNYDVILIDTPAVSQGSDVQLLARNAGGALLLARQHETRIADMENMKMFLEKSGVVCVGAIISNF